MATVSLSPPSTRRSNSFRIVSAIVIFFLVVVALVVVSFVWVAKASLPQLDGQLKVVGLRAPVTILRDGQGMPHIRASSMEDALFAQGYVTAQDRLWQMDITRRFAAGELSEILGADLVRHDREQRILLLPAVAERAASALAPDERRLSEAYCSGVNAFIELRNLHPLPTATSAGDSA